MDPLSHIVVGRALIAAVGDETRPAVRGAGAAAILGALSPDVDGLLIPFGWDIYLRGHEIGTHSIAGALVVGAASGALVAGILSLRLRRRPLWPSLAALIVAGIAGSLSHIVLDLLCGARIRIGWPMVDARVTFPLIAMADPWFVAPCAVALVAAIVIRRRMRTIARGLLAAIVALLCIKGVMLQQAVYSAPTRFVSLSALDARFGSLTEWYGYEHLTGVLRAWRLNGRTRMSMVTMSQPIVADTPLVGASRSLDTVRNFIRTHEFGFPQERTEGDQTTVVWSDLSYCWPKSASNEVAGCALWFGGVFGPDGRALRQQVQVGGWVRTRPISP
jgi:membrane-bound metal-dependent hydrolase YbcI (DUF457 family)